MKRQNFSTKTSRRI